MVRISWKSKEGYERFKDRVEGKLGHKLVDTLETWVSNKYTTKSKPPVICQKILSNGNICGEICNTASIHSIINHGQNIGCECSRFSWKSKEGYERFKDRVEGKLGHKLVDTLETWVSNKYTKKSKPPVICQKILKNGKICVEILHVNVGLVQKKEDLINFHVMENAAKKIVFEFLEANLT